MTEFSWVLLLGGLTFFFFGLNFARNGLQLLAGDRLRLIITRLTSNRFFSLSLGTLITVVLQSSTATILMLMSMAATNLLTLPQAFGVILGADIGTTVVVILLSIKKISDYALLLVVFGYVLEWFSRGAKQTRYIGRILFGFGMVFYGMKLMTQTASPLAGNPEAQILFSLLASHPVAILLASIAFTMVVQTSAATIGMAIALGLAGVIDLPTAIPVVLGANVGTCFTAIVASLGSNTDGKRVAIAHLFVKVSGVVLAMPFIPQIVWMVERCSEEITKWVPVIHPGVAGNIAMVHLFFNVALAILFLPFLKVGVWAVSHLVPEKKKEEVFGPKYLDINALETPPLAFAQAKREILRIANLTYDLYRDGLKMFDPGLDIERVAQEIETQDDKIDLLERKVRFYLAKISQEAMTESQAAQQMALLSIGADLEGVGDVISKQLTRLGEKKVEKRRTFSQQGWQDIQKLHQMGMENFSLTISAFASPAEEVTSKVMHHGERFNILEQQLRQSHIQRLHVGSPETFETSTIHLDILSNLRRINDHLVHMAQLSLQT
ncbi:MAG: Na/Pi cotransporter family protein [Deltaproteobacteria bacterium]|nr:Na/Pi cotransporter family protein [Deltaproteobacteria bacterium]